MWAWLGVSLVALLAGRALGPSDIDDKNQQDTIAYTVDMVRHGEWLLPRSPEGEMTTKPLLYNWLSAPLVVLTHRYDPWVFKLPSTLAGIATLGMIVWMTRRMVARFPPDAGGDGVVLFDRPTPSVTPLEFGLLAGVLWLASPLVFRQMYLARPDGLLVMFLAGGWIAATVLLDGDLTHRFRWQLALWLCVGGAALSKGPAALLPLIYAPLAAKLIHGRWSAAKPLGWWWGLPLAVVMFVVWLIPAWVQNPQHVVEVLLGREFIERIGSGKGGDGVWKPYKSPLYVISRFLPWSLFAVILLRVVRPRLWFNNPLAPAFVWVLVVTAFFACSVGIIPRYVTPAFPAMTALATVGLLLAVRSWNWGAPQLAACGFIAIVILVGHHLTLSDFARTGSGDAMVAFAREVRPIVNEEPIRFEIVRRNPLPSLMGRHLGGPGGTGGTGEAREGAVSGGLIDEAVWVIRPVITEHDMTTATVVSRPARLVDPANREGLVPIGLFRVPTPLPKSTPDDGSGERP